MGPLNSLPHSHYLNRIDDSKEMGKGAPRGRSLAARYCRPQVLVWLLLFLLPSAAAAVMPPWVYQEARDKAMFHVQVKVLKVAGPAQTPGPCAVTGEVVRIFRDQPGTLKPGAVLDFAVDCSKPGDPVVMGGTLWTNYESLLKARYLEVFLNSTERGYEVASWQSRIIEAPTEQPTFTSVGQRPQ
ncbi:MAG TPA: hypothetical protein VKJ47_18845 [Candidatus Binatia bacterium]|nr:hypothetical protein [Candidatus Binatia bacterium]